MISRLILAIIAIVPAFAAAADTPRDLAKLFPMDTILFAGRAGADAAGTMAENTSFGRLLAEPEMKRLVSTITSAIDGLARKEAGREMPPEMYETGRKIVISLWKYPVAFGVIDANLTPNSADVHAAIVCRAGGEAERLANDIVALLRATGAPLQPAKFAGHDLFELATPPEFNKVYFGAVKDCFVVLCGNRSEDVVKRIESGGPNLCEHESLVAARKRMLGSDETRSMCFFADARRIMSKAREMSGAIQGVDREDAEKFFRLLNAVGAENLAGVCWESHYTHDGCYDAMYFHTPGGGKGLLSSKAKNLTEGDLALIPKDAMWATAFNVQLADALRSTLSEVKTLAGPEAEGDIDGAESMATGMLGLPPADFLDLFDDTFIVYDAPDNGGFWISGIVMLAQCKDVDKVQQHIAQFIKNVTDMIGDEARVNIKSYDHNGKTISFINVVGLPMPIAPAWSEHNGWLVVGLYPQMVSATLDRLADGELKKTSILSNSDFMSGRKVLGRLGTSMSYVDTRDGLQTIYPFLLTFAQMGAAMAQGEGVEIDVSAMPSMRTINKHLRSQVQFTQSDADGILSASFGPFPLGYNSLAPASALMLAPVMFVGIPAAAEARYVPEMVEKEEYQEAHTEAERADCKANLRVIAQAMYIHAQDDGRFPSSFQALLDDGNITREQLFCQAMPHAPDAALDTSFVIVPGQNTYSNPSNILVYERRENHADEGGVNVLYQDGHVAFVTLEEFDAQLKATQQRLKVAGN